MANLLKHRFASGKVDGPDATQVQPSHWNDGHMFSGGNAGDLLTRDPTDATYGAKWAPPPAAPVIPTGPWVDVPYVATNFSGPAGTVWAVEASDQLAFAYSIHFGTTAFVLVNLATTSVTGSVGTPLKILLPITPKRATDALIFGFDGLSFVVRVRVFANDPTIQLYRLDGANWALTTNLTFVSGQLILAV